MGQIPELQQARRRLGLALDPLCHDRWTLGFLRGGTVQPIAASDVSRRFLRSRPLLPLARRALYEKRPLSVNSVIDAVDPSSAYEWELDWPAILYVPVAELGVRPVGLLTVGCRRDHWYTEEDIAYAHGLGVTLAPMVTALRGPLGRLNESEGEVAQLLSYGLSTLEVAQAARIDERRVMSLVEKVTKKLQPVSAAELAFPLIPTKRRALRL
ncbi:MAG TPA: GAF domain-containing protein [Candidatus Dormibacteraeota bacterium]|jgi:DNA-binding CsgD family transcriptional regulator